MSASEAVDWLVANKVNGITFREQAVVLCRKLALMVP